MKLAFKVTGKAVLPKDDYPAPYEQTATTIKVPHGDVEALVHELCHWAVATPEERSMFNLGLTEGGPSAIYREDCTWDLEVLVFEPIASEAAIHATLTTMSQNDHQHFWRSDRPSGAPWLDQLPVEELRKVLTAWWTWRQT